MKDLQGKVAVITGAGSGFGREFARLGARSGLRLVLGDVQGDALDETVELVRGMGAEVDALRGDVSRAEDVEALAQLADRRFGGLQLAFNNAGVGGAGGFAWEASVKDWEWVLGVNLMGVVHGIRSFVPRMLAQGTDCHVVNTASVAGLLSPQLMAVYNVSKHGVVALSETLFNDLRTAGAKVGVSVLCPAFVPTGIAHSERNRPAELQDDVPPTPSQQAAQAASVKAVSSGKVTAVEVAEQTFAAVREGRFYILTHPKILPTVELRMQDILQQRDPTDPFTYKPDVAHRA